MSKADKRTVFVCQQCGKESLKWLGRCPDCQEWNSFVEVTAAVTASAPRSASPASPPQPLSRVATESARRISLSISEFNRVLGGGLVPGSLVLISGDPGIGKSTLLLQASAAMAGDRGTVAYVSGDTFFVDRSGSQFIRLAYSFVAEQEIEEAVRRLGRALRRAQTDHRSGALQSGPAK